MCKVYKGRDGSKGTKGDIATLPEVGSPEGEIKEEKQKRHKRNLRRFWEWAKNNKYNIHISYPRSGKDWLRWLIGTITGRNAEDPININYSNYEDFIYFTRHGGTLRDIINVQKHDNKVILLIRDPRDCALSDAYRRVLHDQHEDITTLNETIVNAAVEDVCRSWGSRILAYLKNEPLIVQYELICLEPVSTLTSVIEFLENPEVITAIRDAVIRCDREKIVTGDKENLKVEIKRVEYLEDYERYSRHCLKWQKDPLFSQEHNEIIYDSCKVQMERFGYTMKGQVWKSKFHSDLT